MVLTQTNVSAIMKAQHKRMLVLKGARSGENIRLIEKRKNSGLTQVQVAKQIGVSEVCYQCYESGKRTPRVDTAIKIADALGVKDLRELFADQAELSPHGII